MADTMFYVGGGWEGSVLKGTWVIAHVRMMYFFLTLFSDANSPFNSSYIPGSRSHVVFERVIGYPKPDYAGKLCRRTINSYSKIVCGCVQLHV